MEISTEFSMHWLEIAVAVYLIGMVLYGHYKGFIRLAVSALAIVITLASVHVVMPPVTEWIKNDTAVYGTIKDGIEKAVGLEGILGNTEETSLPEKTEERRIIEGLELPEQLKTLLIENNNGEVYKMMGVELFRDYVGGYLADIIVRCITFAVLFVMVFVLLRVLVIWLDLIAKLPILSGLNQMAGAVLGGTEALIFLWVACLIFTALSGTGAGASVMRQIHESQWLSWIYNHNVLSYLVFSIIRGVL